MAAKGKHRHSAKTRKLMSQIATGKGNPFYGKKHSSAAKRKMSARIKGKNNPMYGRTHSKSARAKISAARRAAVSKRSK